MTRLPSRPLGRTGLAVSSLALGGGPLGSMPENFGYEVPEQRAIELVRATLASQIRVIDTANGYSAGRSEQRIGRAIVANGGLPADVLVMTKVDADGWDYSGERVRASIAESRERLGLTGPLPLVFLHDPEFHDFDELTAPGGAVDALVRARADGAIAHIGLAGGDVHTMMRYVELGAFEVVLVHNRWTIVDRSAGALIERAVDLGMGVVNAAVLGGGILAGRGGPAASYGYRPVRSGTQRAIERMRDLCEHWGTDLATAAIRFSTRDERIATTVVGISKRSRLEATITAATAELPDQFWAELETLVPSPDNWLDSLEH